MRNLHLSKSFIFTDFRSLSSPIKILAVFTILSFCFPSNYSQIYAQSNKQINKSKKPQTQNSNLTGNIFYVAPNGTISGNGSINNPWTLRTALSNTTVVQPGDTIYLRGGTYNVPVTELGFTSTLTGTPENPIKVLSYPGEWAVIDGNVSFSPIKSKVLFRINGNNTWFMNFEITNTETGNRKIDIIGSNPPERRANAVEDSGMGTKLINLVIHDAGQGISAANDFNGSEYYGNVVYNNGWDAPDDLYGHGNYVQNDTGTKKLEENFFFNNFKFNSQMYGSSSSASRNFTWLGNVFFNGGMAWWGPNIQNLVVRENFTYKQVFKIGNGVKDSNTDAIVQNNYFMYGVNLDTLSERVVFTNNTVWHDTNDPLLTINSKSFWDPSKFSIDQNIYYKNIRTAPDVGHFRLYFNQKLREMTFNETVDPQRYAITKKSWQQDFRLDQNSTYVNSVPTQLMVFVRPNRYDSRRANIVIYNWSQAQTVNVNVSSILNPGDTYELRNVQDYFGDVITGTYSGGEITVNMIGRTRAKPIGYDQVSSWYHDPLRPNTFPTFGAFVIRKTSSS